MNTNLNLLITDELFITTNINHETTTLGYGCGLYYEILFSGINLSFDEVEALSIAGELIEGIDYGQEAIYIETTHPQFNAISRRVKDHVSFTFTDGDTVEFSKGDKADYFNVYEIADFRDGEEFEIGNEEIGCIASSLMDNDEEFWKLATKLGFQI